MVARMTRWGEIMDAVGVALSGERERGVALLTRCWDGTTDGDHGQRCVIAHYLADLQDDLDAEVAWDTRALAEHGQVADADLTEIGIPSSRVMAPSLHLNLGDGCLRQGRVHDARAQLGLGLATVDELEDDGYGAMIRQGLLGLQERIQATGARRRRSRPAGPMSSGQTGRLPVGTTPTGGGQDAQGRRL